VFYLLVLYLNQEHFYFCHNNFDLAGFHRIESQEQIIVIESTVVDFIDNVLYSKDKTGAGLSKFVWSDRTWEERF
jgi:hypothetical protein